MAIDFGKLTSVQMSDVKRPPSLPVCTMLGRIVKYEFRESDWADKDTKQKEPQCRVHIKLLSPGPDIDAGELEGIDYQNRPQSRDYSIAEGKQFPFKSMVENVTGQQTDGMSLAQAANLLVNCDVQVEIKQRPNKDDPNSPYNSVGRISSIQ